MSRHRTRVPSLYVLFLSLFHNIGFVLLYGDLQAADAPRVEYFLLTSDSGGLDLNVVEALKFECMLAFVQFVGHTYDVTTFAVQWR